MLVFARRILYTCFAISHKKMQHNAISIRPFIGAKDFEISRSFYRELGFEEIVLTPKMSVFKTGALAFYLQDGYVKEWIDNTMIFLEVDDVARYFEELSALNLSAKYNGVRLTKIRNEPWGQECFLHDPSGILWHFGEFFPQAK
jgi:catechol 2,3-dioxygenase-like lactoylglutathione lyase family enzyme